MAKKQKSDKDMKAAFGKKMGFPVKGEKANPFAKKGAVAKKKEKY